MVRYLHLERLVYALHNIVDRPRPHVKLQLTRLYARYVDDVINELEQ